MEGAVMLQATWPGGWVVSMEGRAVWEGSLEWMALELDVHRCTDFYLSPGEGTLRQKVRTAEARPAATRLGGPRSCDGAGGRWGCLCAKAGSPAGTPEGLLARGAFEGVLWD